MNQQELEKHIKFQIILYILTGFCFICFLIYIFATPVKAIEQVSTINPKVDCSGSCGCGTTTNRYCATQTNQTPYTRTTNTTYNGVLQCISFEYVYSFNATYPVYTLTLNAMSTDFRNNDLSLTTCSYSSSPSQCNTEAATLRYVSKSKIQIIYNTDNSRANHVVTLCGDPLTGISTYGIKSMKLSYDDNQQDNSDIINNQNQNTTDIINNNNSNTQDIIDSNNENTQNIVDGLQDLATEQLVIGSDISYMMELFDTGCLSGPLFYGSEFMEGKGYINDSGAIVRDNNSNYRYSKLFKVKTGASYSFAFPGDNSNIYACFYTASMSSPLCRAQTTANANVAINNGNRPYLRFTFRNSSDALKITGPVCNDWTLEEQQAIHNTNKEIYSEIQNQTDYLTDDSDPTLNNSGIDSALSSVQIDDPLNYLLTLPISLLQKLNTVLSSNSCQRVSFGSLYNTELYLPCINFSEIIGSNLWNTIDLFVGVGLLAVILKKFYESISNILTMGKEKEVKDKLDLPTPMQFLASILGGGKD